MRPKDRCFFERSKLVACLLLLACAIFPRGMCSADNILDTLGANHVISFEGDWRGSMGNGMLLDAKGGTQISDGVEGKALSLGPGEYLVLDARQLVSSSEGTIEFWVRPHWTQGDTNSHTFASLGWSDGRGGYFTVTRGWWEPTGSAQSFFIFNNQDSMDIYEQLLYSTSEWTHFACVWKTGAPAYVKFYVNGSLLGELTPASLGTYPVSGPFFLGTDTGCSAYSQGRYADSDFDELASFDRALDDGQIMSIYNAQNPNPAHYPQIGPDGFMLETRAIFDEDKGWMTAQGAQETIRRIKAAGFNAYVPCIWHGSGTRYPSALAPPEPGVSFPGDDPLANLIKIAHDNGIKVYPWFTVTLRQLDFFSDFYGPGTPPEAFDLQRPGFRKFIEDLIVDVATRYDIDGINLDYIRAMGLCSCEYCQKAYLSAMGRNLSDDVSQAPSDTDLPPYLQQWVDQCVQALVTDVFSRIKNIKPGLCLSVDDHPLPVPDRQGRQSVKWANSGLVDQVFDMDYTDPPNSENHNLMRAQFNDPTKFVELLSNYYTAGETVLPTSADVVSAKIDRARRRWGDGIGLYLYSMLTDEQVSSLGGKIFNSPARPRSCSLDGVIVPPANFKLKTGN